MTDTVIFLHIPKTGGSTLYRIIERQYRARHIYTMWQDGSLEAFKQLSRERRSEIQLLRGHFGYGIDQYLPNAPRYFTFLREPIDQVISYYHFVRRVPHHYSHEVVTANGLDVRAFVESWRDPMVNNAQTRLLCGLETGQELSFGAVSRAELETAKRNLREHISVIGITESFDETLLLLKRAFGWRNVYYARQNVTRLDKADMSTEQREFHATDAATPLVTGPGQGSMSGITGMSPTQKTSRKYAVPDETIQAIAQVNELDIELYHYALALFEKQIDELGPTFANEVKVFQQRNRLLRPLTQASADIRKASVRAFVKKQWSRFG